MTSFTRPRTQVRRRLVHSNMHKSLSRCIRLMRTVKRGEIAMRVRWFTTPRCLSRYALSRSVAVYFHARKSDCDIAFKYRTRITPQMNIHTYVDRRAPALPRKILEKRKLRRSWLRWSYIQLWRQIHVAVVSQHISQQYRVHLGRERATRLQNHSRVSRLRHRHEEDLRQQ